MDTLKRVGYCILAILIAAVIYGWSLWYYGGLYQSGALLSASQVTAETLLPTLSQELIVVLPEILAAVIAWALLGWKQFPQEMGLKAESVKKEILSLLAGGYLGALFLALLTVKSEPLTICYQWGYYLFLIALWEEFIFRGLLPLLVEKGGVPTWVIWLLPGVLFACMHTLMPIVKTGFAAESFVFRLLSVLGGYTVGHCGFYALRKWSGTLWLPVLVHGLLDFSSVFIT